jgi:hypothetical protein
MMSRLLSIILPLALAKPLSVPGCEPFSKLLHKMPNDMHLNLNEGTIYDLLFANMKKKMRSRSKRRKT